MAKSDARRHFRIIVVNTIIILFFPIMGLAYASENPSEDAGPLKVWLDVGVGGFAGDEYSGVGTVSGISIENNRGLFKLRRSYYEEGNIFGDVIECGVFAIFNDCDDPVAEMEEWALMYGKKFSNSNTYWAAGLSTVKGRQIGINKRSFSGVGIPLEIHWRPTLGKHFGIGVMALANINRNESFGGILMTFQLGDLN